MKSVKSNLISLDQVKLNKICGYIHKINENNAAMVYCLSKLFQISRLCRFSFSIMKRFFPNVIECQNFLECDFISVRRILTSSEITFSSEIQVYNAIEDWVSHNVHERTNFKQILLDKFPFQMLSFNALDYLAHKNSRLNDVSAGIIKQVLSSEMAFQILIKGEVYLIKDLIIRRYSPTTADWSRVGEIHDDHTSFCTCSFLGDFYLIGGHRELSTRTCFKLNTEDRSWKEIPEITQARSFADCCVFQGKIVVSGGYQINNNKNLRAVEAYDNVERTWSRMPSLIEGRYHHKSIAMRNKLFVVGGPRTANCEIFDSTCNKFVLLKSTSKYLRSHLAYPDVVFSVGSKLIIFDDEETILIYDSVDLDWTEKNV